MALFSSEIYRKFMSGLIINRHTLIAKFTYMCLFSCYGIIESFLTSFLTDIGLTPRQAGIVSGMRAITNVVGNILLTVLADKTRRHRLIIFVIGLAVVSTLLPMPWLARSIRGSTHCKSCIQLTDISTNASGCQQLLENKQNVMFGSMLALNLLTAFFYGPVVGFADSAVMMYVKRCPVPSSIDQQLRFASLGWAIGPAIVGIMSEYISFGDLSKYTPLFIVYAVCMVSTCFALIRMYTRMSKDHLYVDLVPNNTAEIAGSHGAAPNIGKTHERGTLAAVLHTFKKKQAIFLYIAILALATSLGVQDATLLLFMLDLGASRLNQGLATFSELGSEFICYSLVGWITVKVGGRMRALSASCLLYFLRALAISFIPNPWYVLPILSLTSLFQPIFYTSMLELTSEICPPELETALFGFGDSVVTIGVMMGTMAGGAIFQSFGGRALFRIAAVHMIIWFVVIVLYDTFFKSSVVSVPEEQPLLKDAENNEKRPVSDRTASSIFA